MSLKDLLKEMEIFSSMSDQELEEIASSGVRKNYKKDEIILKEAEYGSALYIISKGQVKISIYSDEGNETILNFLGPGDFFGEMALFLDSIRCANVIAMKETEVFIFKRENFYEILKRNFNITKKIIAMLCNRLRQANIFIEGLANLDVYGRVIRFFKDICKNHGKDEGQFISIPKINQEDIAHKIASTRETISRIIASLKQSELLEIKKDRILVSKKLLK